MVSTLDDGSTSEASLRFAIGEYIEHFHQERPHQGLANEIIEPDFDELKMEGDIECRSRLGGLMKHNFRNAA